MGQKLRTSALGDIRVEQRPIASLRPAHRNPRTHSERQIRQIANSIETFGFTNPILIDAQDTVIAGHGRLRAARQLGMKTVPTIRLHDLTKEQARALVIADNKLAELAGWDKDLLALELKELADLDLDFDLAVVGFEAPEIDLLIGEAASARALDPADEVGPIDPDVPVISRPGDLWQIGPHRLLCGDATNTDSYARLLEGKRAQMVFTDPPYNVRIDGHVSGHGRIQHAEFAMASGEMSQEEFIAFLENALGHHAKFSVDGAIHFICIDWRHMGELLEVGRRIYDELKNVCVWVKSNAGLGSLYRSQHELVFVFKHGNAPHVNNIELGRFGRSRTNVWSYAGANTFGPDRAEALAMHPTVKPVRMAADAILDCSRRGAIVLDGFAGSGTMVLAAELTGRIGYAIEIAPRYADVAIRRLVEHAGLDAVHAESGRTFAEVAEMRARAASSELEEPVDAALDAHTEPAR